MYGNKEGTIALANAGANLAVSVKNNSSLISLMVNIIRSGLFNTSEVNNMITEDYIKALAKPGDVYDSNISSLLANGYHDLDNTVLYVNHLVDTTVKALGKKIAASLISPDLDSQYWLLVADALERNGVMIWFADSCYDAKKISNNERISDKIYELTEKVVSGSVEASNLPGLCKAVIAICNKYNKSPSILSSILTQSSFDTLNTKEQWGMLDSAVYTDRYFGGNSSAFVKCLNKLKFKTPTRDEVSSIVDLFCHEARNFNPSDLLARLVCRKIRPYVNLLSGHDIYVIAWSPNYYFINAMVDAGLGEDLAELYSMSDVCRSVLRENGLINDDEQQNNTDAHHKNAELVRAIIKHIANDTMSQSVRQAINENPAILDDDKIQDVLNNPDYEQSATARQLKRQYDQWVALPENKNKYDM
jgi:hypothetical protein